MLMNITADNFSWPNSNSSTFTKARCVFSTYTLEPLEQKGDYGTVSFKSPFCPPANRAHAAQTTASN